ncbi:MAG: TRAP transporter small permease [Kiritimatiellia bacterium]|nr:TRAP transporter small permease [Lentisphaerota bacterium]
MSGRLPAAYRTISRWVDRLERHVLAILVTGMVILAALQILMRNVWHTGWNWAEPLLGMALLWLTMLGALAATGQGRHISIDLAGAFFPKRWRGLLQRFISLFAAIICGILAWAAGRYIGFQREMDMTVLLGIPAHQYYMVIPVVFWLMVIRFAGRAFIPAGWQTPPSTMPDPMHGAGDGT